MKYYKYIVGTAFAFALAFGVGIASTSAQTTGTMYVSYVRNLTVGSVGPDVMALQKFLNAKGYTVALSGAGSAGLETQYFGPFTRSALARYQAANGITPPAGYFGPITRAYIAAQGNLPPVGVPNNPSNPLSGGDGDFTDFDLLGDPSNEDIEEGEDSAVLGFEFEADDSDLRVERIDIELSGDADEKPWKYIESITLYNGDDEVASIDASDSDEWDEIGSTDVYEATFADVDSIVREGNNAEFYIYVEAKSSIDDSDLPIVWTLEIPTDGIRALNADGINVYEGGIEETFTLEVAEAGEFDISVDSDENEDSVVEVDEDNDTDDVVLYTATIESDSGDNVIEELSFNLESGSSSVNSVVKTFYLEVDGDQVASESSTGLDDTTGTVTFDDLDIEVDEDDEVVVKIIATVRSTDTGDNYLSGETLQVTEVSVDYVDEQDDDLTETDTTDGGVITLSDDSVMVELASTTAVKDSDDRTKGTYTIKFDVTAPEDEDVYIDIDSAGDSFEIIDASTGATTTATTTSATLSGGTITSGKIKISEGQTKTLTLMVSLDNEGGVSNKTLRVGLTEVYYRVGSAGADEEIYTSGLDEDFETESLLLYTTQAN